MKASLVWPVVSFPKGLVEGAAPPALQLQGQSAPLGAVQASSRSRRQPSYFPTHFQFNCDARICVCVRFTFTADRLQRKLWRHFNLLATEELLKEELVCPIFIINIISLGCNLFEIGSWP